MSKFKILLISIFIFGAILRVWTLDADPSILLDSGQVGDEGYWLYNARSLATWGKTAIDDFYHDFAAAPIFSFFAYVSFSALGVGFFQARFVSAIAGIITLIFTYQIAKQVEKKVGLLATFLVAINTLLLLHNRLAVGESLSIMFTTIGFYLLFRKRNEYLAGGAFSLAILSKTTSFLYLPSVFLIMFSGYKNRGLIIKNFTRFCTSFIVLTILIFGFIYLEWGRQISLIYLTFGAWYAPRTFTDIWQNILNFFLHPFWGSPFLFSLLILAILNSLNFLLEKMGRTFERKFLILWILGIVILGPFIWGLSNARMLGLVIPIAILGAQAITNPTVRKINFSKLNANLIPQKRLFLVFTFLVSAPAAVIAAKLILAGAKRLIGDATIVYKLPYLALFFLIIFAVISLKNRRFLDAVLKFDLYMLLFLPLASFIPLFWGYLNFFEFAPPPQTTVVSIMTIISFVAFYLLIKRFTFSRTFIVSFLAIYIFFNLIGIATIIYKPTYKIEKAAERVGEIISRQIFIGFYGHPLAIGNRSWPIYWAPKLNYVSGVNADYQKYNPKFLLVSEVFDSRPGSLEAWPDTKSINQNTRKVATLELSRNFWRAKREFRLSVFELLD